ncbi:hypothetical protein BDP27DRAFT_1386312 [Rhodocollybia butyracea]|uniref:Helitron helicase-like domain-containing protein n=1 Tax=Rhodocollybia butyracea TaxID=206335 RepID=A0A9P5P653_9AGAR|nr:hypothetical protein BDP27DRAFT_1386312 [Rhodocollybia butyracea]
MHAFIRAVLGFDPSQKCGEGGILGVVKAHYGCVEAQGRGTLHCHMMIWLEGGLNPDEIKQKIVEDPDSHFCHRLREFLDDTISNSVPADPDPSITVPSDKYHPCALRNSDMQGYECDPGSRSKRRLKDMRNLIKHCQVHSHTSTCYKYCKDPSQPKECRFHLGEDKVEPLTMFDPISGDITLRCLDGLVNNFNETMLEAIRCNMDIKFIGSGASAKAVLYYITNYITKTQLKSHVAFAALERAVTRLEEVVDVDTPLTVKAKRLLQKCAYAMVSQQELSAQQDHFTSHRFTCLFWPSFERHIDNLSPLVDDTSVETTTTGVDPVPSSSTEASEPPESLSDESDLYNVDEEVTLSVDSEGTLGRKGNQVEDYCLRGDQLNDVNMTMLDWTGKMTTDKNQIPATTSRIFPP